MDKLGSGKRFSKLMDKLKKEKSVTNPRALAAHIGMEKYGKAKIEKMAQKGKARKEG